MPCKYYINNRKADQELYVYNILCGCERDCKTNRHLIGEEQQKKKKKNFK